MIIELLPNKIGCFLTRLDEVRHLKVVEPHEVILGDFPFLIEKAICALVFFSQIYSVNLCTTITFNGEKSHRNWTSYVKDIGS